MPEITHIFYETGREETEILGSGVSRDRVLRTHIEEEAFREFGKLGRTYLHRHVCFDDKTSREDEWNWETKQWRIGNRW